MADPDAGPTDDPYKPVPRTSGTFLTIGQGHRLVWLASQLGLWHEGSVLDWVPNSGGRIFELNRSITAGDPMPELLNASQFSIPPERELIYLDHERVLDWDRFTGDILIWDYDRSATTTDPFPTRLNSTSFPNVREDHQIVYLGGDMLLIWNETSGEVEVWRYDRTLLGEVDPFTDLEMSDSWTGEIEPGRKILYLGEDQVLDWDPTSGSHRIWSFDRPRMPAAQFDFLLNTDLDTAAHWVARAQERIVAYQVALAGSGTDPNFSATDDALRTHFHAQDHPSGLQFALAAILDMYVGMMNRFSTGTGSILQVTKETAISDLGGVSDYTRGYSTQGVGTRLTPAYRTNDTIGHPGLDGAGPRLRAAILIHETTHFLGDNPDTALEWQIQAYDALTPELALRNPASYASFAHQVTEGTFLRFGLEPWI
ncbi:hypothetical protein [Nonomuraea sp. SBT364]|uniref:hypothetical protein n=1 Tax=Nonomuraea sp. SBT364 TaxID=1580530 RepID=UPI0012E18A8E|nr:hypothetical protein [Nonomuraea sp. SBT364]